MKTKISLIIVVTCLFQANIISNDSIRYDLLKLEKIQVDTLMKINTESYLGCANLQFRKSADTLISLSFVSIMSSVNPTIKYKWTSKASSLNFTLKKGIYYSFELSAFCQNELEEDCFYAQFSDFNNDSCSISTVFNTEKEKNNYQHKMYHYAHMNDRVYKIQKFFPTIIDEIKNSGYRLDFIPIKLSK